MTPERRKRRRKTVVKPGQLRVWREEAHEFECTYLVVGQEDSTTRWITLIVCSNEARMVRTDQLMDDNQCRGDELVCDA